MKKILYILIVLCAYIPTMEAQTLKAFMKAAEESMMDKDFYNAMYYHSEIVKFDTSNMENIYKYAESAKLFNAFTIAEEQFERVHSNDTENQFPLASFHLADVQQQLGKYELAKQNYNLFLSENGTEYPVYSQRAEKELEAIDWAMDERDNPQPGVTVEHLGGDVNSPYSDFGAIEKDDDLYYSSLRFNKADNKVPTLVYSQILKQGDFTWDEKQDSIDNSLNEYQLADQLLENSRIRKKKKEEESEIVSSHEAHTSFSEDGARMYYTICHYINASDIRCDIHVKSISENGQFGSAKKLPSAINSPDNTATQPNIAYNKVTGQEFLYFVSDREAGKGGLDLWYSEYKDGNYSMPMNLKELNTIQDEVSPFFHSSTNTLYFSSNGRMGMGGHDVFSSDVDDTSYGEPVNLKAPTNTSFNDLYYSLNAEGTKAYFSSNRTGSLYLEESYEACCYDIYRADIEEVFVDLNILTFDSSTDLDLENARVRIYDLITGELLHDNINELGNDHKFKLKCGREYKIITDRTGYESDTTTVSLKNCDEPEITKKIYLTPEKVKLDVYTFLNPGSKPLEGATVTLYDLSDPKSEPIVITQLNDNDFHFDIIGGREYKLVATKSGFEPQTLLFKAENYSDGILTKKIYFENGAPISLNEFLPVVVYFDNDSPDRRSRKLYTNQSYSDSYFPYIDKKEEFKREYSKQLGGDAKLSSQYNLESFFETDVRGGYERLQLFVSKLNERLKRGDKVELSLKGFASPRAANKYNLALGQRRIWTLKNELKQYGGGMLRSYIDSGALKVIEVSYGEEASPNDISDSYGNRRLSVYSVEASRQRKAEIVRVRITN